MNYNHPRKNNSTIAIRVMCAIVFVLFSILWLYCFQADLLMMTQHVLSGGVTHYNPVVGTIIITATLVIVQLAVYGFLRLNRRFHALTYLPSMFLLAMLTSMELGQNGGGYGMGWWRPLIIFVLWICIVWIARQLQEVEDDESYSLFSRPMWINILIMSLLIMCVAWLSNTNAVFHYRMKVERLLSKGYSKQALRIGDKSLESDENLLMLRMYALARENALGDRLFTYPIIGTSSQMLPTSGKSKMLFAPVDSLYRFLGGKPVGDIEPMHFLELLACRDSIVPRQVVDYRLCGLLIDRKIDQFANEIQSYYSIDDHLPIHYREALTLYTHLKGNPVIVYHHPVLDEDWKNMHEMENKYSDPMERKGKLNEQYRGTYWYYYKYCK